VGGILQTKIRQTVVNQIHSLHTMPQPALTPVSTLALVKAPTCSRVPGLGS
jgi:hypothetical protein